MSAPAPQPQKISIPGTLSSITKPWSPKLIATLNSSHDVKLAKLQGEFVWHSHPNTDELFYCVSGEFTIRFREDPTVALDDVVMKTGDMLVIPRSVRHCPAVAEGIEACAMIIELGGTVNTGDADGEGVGRVRNEVEDVRGRV
ncbi:cupin 2 conserved barrel domain protein [Rhizodiscina lignyota]|uniref:Cupin 2 conserved barrel domain protein n=1 Tax=Rhizodiscina lignyota TaxID=1504668 RepID=A0A9P4I8X3_9PEZI|nr:cupin 2 conserved barrel domain protein [Rhizodiscina lignyota]